MNNLTKIKLPICGKEVEIEDIKKADGHMLMQARMLADERISAGVYILANLCRIDGKKITADEILDLDLEDVVALEDYYLELKKNLISTRKK